MPEDKKKDSLDVMLRKAAAEKYGIGGIVEDIEKIKPLIEKVNTLQDFIKGDPGKDGYSPVLGKDYLTEEDQQRVIDGVRPKKNVDYFDGEPGKTPVKGVDYMTPDEIGGIKQEITPVKGQDYFTNEDVANFKKAVTPVKGTDYNDGENPTPAQFLEVVKGLKGQDAASFSQIIGSKIDISHVRNAGSFIFNGQKYDTSELMHGGGSGGGGGGGTVKTISISTAHGLTGSSNGDSVNPTITLATTVTGVVKGDGTSFSTATPNVDYQVPIVFTTTGTSGAATFDGTNLNIPNYATGAPGGLNAQLQYNNSGVFGGITGATTDGTSVSLSAAHLLNPTINGAGTGLATLTYPNTATSVSIAFPATAGTIALTSDLTGFVTSVSGTTNRITSSGGTTPAIDISASYVGQTSITTLGTIATGTWTGTTIALAHGGTGLTSIAALSIWIANTANTLAPLTPSAGQSIRINAGNTAWEAYTPTVGTVTAISVATSNGFAGSSSGGATPAITISTSITGILQGNGTAISAATTTGTGSVVQNNKPTFLGMIQTRTVMAAQAIDGSLGNMFSRTLAGSETFTQSNISVGQNIIVEVTNAVGGGDTVTWFSGITWVTSGGTAPVQASGASAITTYGFTCTASNTFLGYVVGTQ